MPSTETLTVSATFDGRFPEWYDLLPEPKRRMSTAEGGFPTRQYIRAFREDTRRHRGYLFVQDSMEPLGDVVAPFLEASEKYRTPVVGWARFGMFFDNAEQEQWVRGQYPFVEKPDFGVFGSVFWVDRKVMESLDKLGRFPKTATTKLEDCGNERAWAYAFKLLGIKPAFLHDWSPPHLESGNALPFRKVYLGRH